MRLARPVFVLAGGAVAGTLDILYAWTFWRLKAGVPLQRILQSVAAGLIGTRSFNGDTGTAALGLALHFFIATTMSIVYFLGASRWRSLARHPIRSGAIYGLGLYYVMHYVVVPLSAAAPGSTDPLWIVLSVAVHVCFIGIPIAIAARYAHRSP